MENKTDKINILPPSVYNLLAAGEVVENPASIVKELIENAIDAGATKISVSIANGGIDEIVVTDNGRGCPEGELSKIFLPHATSKIATEADIDGICSLGFRGEAMASIAAVARVEFTSKPRSQNYAVRVTNADKGQITPAGDGTTVKVSNLFYNTPARRKFLKTETTERNNVTAAVHNVIFSHPALTVKYTVDGQTILDFRGAGLPAAINEIYAVSADEMLPVEDANDGIKIGGYISNIKLAKKNRSRQAVIVNGRAIDGGIIAAAANETMSNFLMTGEYPIFVLTVTIDTAKVDVNVHPQKREVRFADRDLIISAIQAAVTKALDGYFLSQRQTPNFLSTERKLPKKGLGVAFPQTPKRFSAAATARLAEISVLGDDKQHPQLNKQGFVGKSFDPAAVNPESREVFLRAMKFLDDGKPSAMVAGASSVLSEFLRDGVSGSLTPPRQEKFELPPEIEQTEADGINRWRVLGQAFDTYLLVSANNNLLIIDQHAMAERINFDKFKQMTDSREVSSQPLLTPEIIKLSPREQTAIEKIKPHLIAMGFDIDDFGADAIRISAIPSVFTAFSCDEFMRAVLADRDLQTDKLSGLLRDRIATMACRASIKAGDVMTDAQISAFIANYQKTDIVPLCPHGRPIMLVYSKSKIENLFGRK